MEHEGSACLQGALQANQRIILPEVNLFADGVAVDQIGEHPFAIAKQYVDEVMTINTDEICAAIKDIYDDTRSISEPSGALGVAAIKKYVEYQGIKNQTLIAINCGANVNFDRLRHIAERAELGEKREAIIAVKIPERPGSFKAFCHALGTRHITEFNYRYGNQDEAQIFVGVQLKSSNRQALLDTLATKNYPVVDLTDDEMAKIHIRYMVGGQADIKHELVYRFQFPERPGALLNFLIKVGDRWSITMFHYRNHGAAEGRVLAGFKVLPENKPCLLAHLDELQYPFHEETANPAYQLFLKP